MNFAKPGEGFYVINKPVGMTSFGVVHRMRRVLGIERIGHAGTLDPFASGVLVVAVGRTFTRQISEWQDKPKTYVATMVMGKTTETLDIDGKTMQKDADFESKQAQIRAQLEQPDFWTEWRGEQMQTPPIFSAKKVGGKRAYKLARKNEAVELAPVTITIHDIRLTGVTQEADELLVTFETTCSKGTYIRQLAADIAAKVGTLAYLSVLVRTAIGEAKLDAALSLESVSAAAVSVSGTL